jgi:hypothetical protein
MELTLGEFFSARAEDLDDAVLEGGPFGRFPVPDRAAHGLTERSLATLGEILGVGTYDGLVDELGEGSQQAESGEAGVLAIPGAFRDTLAAASDFDAVAERWMATRDVAFDGVKKKDVVEWLRELGEFAQVAAWEGENLWFWWSLGPFKQ